VQTELCISFTTAIGILIRKFAKKLLAREEALGKPVILGNQGRYKKSILEAAKRRLGVGT